MSSHVWVKDLVGVAFAVDLFVFAGIGLKLIFNKAFWMED